MSSCISYLPKSSLEIVTFEYVYSFQEEGSTDFSKIIIFLRRKGTKSICSQTTSVLKLPKKCMEYLKNSDFGSII